MSKRQILRLRAGGGDPITVVALRPGPGDGVNEPGGDVDVHRGAQHVEEQVARRDVQRLRALLAQVGASFEDLAGDVVNVDVARVVPGEDSTDVYETLARLADDACRQRSRRWCWWRSRRWRSWPDPPLGCL